MLDFVIIADGGGTKTQATGVRGRDGVSFEAAAGSCVPGTDMLVALRSIEDVTERLLGDAQVDRTRSRIGLSLACAGLDISSSKLSFVQQLKARFDSVIVRSDGVAALDACVNDKSGAVVAIGTGVVATARTSAHAVIQLDGWGWPAGDRGGGAWIGRNAVERYLEAVDWGATGFDPLFNDISSELGADKAEIFDWLASATRRDYAAIARLVVSAAAEGSGAGQKLLREAAVQVECLGSILGKKHGIKSIYITGGLATSLSAYLNTEQFQLFPDATFAGAALGAAEWLRDFTPATVQGI